MGYVGKSLPLHKPPSMSKSALLLSPCSRWAHPGSKWFDESVRDASDTAARDNGILFHRVMDCHLNGKVVDAPTVGPLVAHAVRYIEQDLGPRCDSIQSEVAIGVNWATGEIEAGDWPDRAYPYKDGWQYGTADLVCVLKTGELLVADWKTGGSDGATEQLLSLACGLQKLIHTSDTDTAVPRNVIISCLSVNEHGVWPNERPVSNAELAAHWDAMRFKWEDLEKETPYVPGVHCTALYCNHLAYCPAIVGAVEESAKADKSVSEPKPCGVAVYTDSPVSGLEAGYTMAVISAARRQMKYTEAQLKNWKKTTGGKVVCGDYEWSDGNNGYRWRLKPWKQFVIRKS